MEELGAHKLPRLVFQEEDYEFSEDSIVLQDDGTFLIRGDASLEDVNTVLCLNLAEDSALKEFATLSGFLCMCAGEIPSTGDLIMSRGWCFEIEHADDKKVLLAKVERLVGEEEEEDEEASNNIIKAFMRLSNNDESGEDAEGVDSTSLRNEARLEEDMKRSREAKIAEAQEIERIIEGGANKISMLKEVSNGRET